MVAMATHAYLRVTRDTGEIIDLETALSEIREGGSPQSYVVDFVASEDDEGEQAERWPDGTVTAVEPSGQTCPPK
jgi:hypothetical protein